MQHFGYYLPLAPLGPKLTPAYNYLAEVAGWNTFHLMMPYYNHWGTEETAQDAAAVAQSLGPAFDQSDALGLQTMMDVMPYFIEGYKEGVEDKLRLAPCWKSKDLSVKPCWRWPRDLPFLKQQQDRILGFYVADEPNGWDISAADVALIVDTVHQAFPTKPTVAVYLLDGRITTEGKCEPVVPVYPAYSDPLARPNCVVASSVAPNLDWLSIDSYFLRTRADVSDYWAKPILKLAEDFPGKPILPVVEAFNDYLHQFSGCAISHYPNAEQQGWYADSVSKELGSVEVIGFLYFAYAFYFERLTWAQCAKDQLHPPYAERPDGARYYPDAIAQAKALFKTYHP